MRSTFFPKCDVHCSCCCRGSLDRVGVFQVIWVVPGWPCIVECGLCQGAQEDAIIMDGGLSNSSWCWVNCARSRIGRFAFASFVSFLFSSWPLIRGFGSVSLSLSPFGLVVPLFVCVCRRLNQGLCAMAMAARALRRDSVTICLASHPERAACQRRDRLIGDGLAPTGELY